jgi:prepilin-type N-terminal cleavage/methylation domain-containing protein
MKRKAFSLIELIFVIILLGILSVIAIAKFGQMAERANQAKLNAFTGTLNRSVGPSLWQRSIQESNGGSIALPVYQAEIMSYSDFVPGYTVGPDLTACNVAGNGVFLAYPASLMGSNYEIHCQDGTVHESPNFRLFNADTGVYIN